MSSMCGENSSSWKVPRQIIEVAGFQAIEPHGDALERVLGSSVDAARASELR